MNKKILRFIKKKNKTKLVVLTAYSKNIAAIIDKYCDLVLVGDSLGWVLYNYTSTQKVSLSMMIEHSKTYLDSLRRFRFYFNRCNSINYRWFSRFRNFEY